MKKGIFVFDYEVYKAVVFFGYINVRTGKIRIFELSKRKNNSRSHKKFIKEEVSGLVGFNNGGYDSKILDYHLKTKITNTIKYYEFSQRIIQKSYFNDNPIIPQLDLFKIGHYDRFGVSLKTCELRMNFHNVADLPYPFDANLNTTQIKKVKKYLVNDLEATFELFKLFKQKIYLRDLLKREYDLPCLNWSDTKIGEEMLLRKYCELAEKDIDEVRLLRTPRTSIAFKDIIPDHVSFIDKDLSDLLKTLKKTTVKGTKGAFKQSITLDDVKYDLGTGGLHGAQKGIWEVDDEYKIAEWDASSFYPSRIIEGKLYPEHLGPAFYETLDKAFVTPRNKELKPQLRDPDLHYKTREKLSAISDTYKLSGNSVYGLSNSPYSPFYDPKFTLSVTVPCQLFLLMFIDKLRATTSAEVLTANTDGVLIKYKRSEEEAVRAVSTWWESTTNLVMEETQYQKIVQRDCNNLIWIDDKGKAKCKGAYEVDKMVGSSPALHKDNSQRIVALAVREYFISGTSINDTIINHDNIYDFCIGKKANKGWFFSAAHKPDSNDIKLRNIKTLRYYVSNAGSVLYKNHEDGRQAFLEAGLKNKEHKGHYWKLKMFNKFKQKTMKEYNIDYSYYEREAQKLIHAIEKHISPKEEA
jgi:hypothetical protein